MVFNNLQNGQRVQLHASACNCTCKSLTVPFTKGDNCANARAATAAHKAVFACFAGGSMGHRDKRPCPWWSNNSSPFLIARVLCIIGT